MATPIQTDTTCPVCDLTNENLEGLPCSASAEMERFLATLGPSTPEPQGFLAKQPAIVVKRLSDGEADMLTRVWHD